MNQNRASGYGERLKEIRGKLSQEEFGNLLGATRKQISDYESERTEPDMGFLATLLAKFGIAMEWVITGKGAKTVQERFQSALTNIYKNQSTSARAVNDELSHFGFVKRADYAIAATVPAGTGHFTDRTDSVETESLAEYSADEHVFIQISSKMGDSMRPLLRPGDLVLVSRKAKIKDGDLVAAQWGADEGAVKIYYDMGDRVQLHSINLAVEPIKLPKKMVHMYKVVLIKKKS